MDHTVDLLHEVGMLAKTPRSGFAFLGSGEQSVAEHSFRTVWIALVLAKMIKQPTNREKLMFLCLAHDLPEARTGDHNYVNKKYVAVDLDPILEDYKQYAYLGEDIVSAIQEYENNESLEAAIAHDADQLELLLALKEEEEAGNPRASLWMDNTLKRLKTPEAQQLADTIRSRPSEGWWMRDPEDPHWVSGGRK